MSVRLFFVRHAQTDWNAVGKAQGHSDTPLNELGARQAGLLCERLLAWEPMDILSSDLRRAADTVAGLVAAGWPFEACASLRERNLGEWEGRPFGWIQKESERLSQRHGLPIVAVRPPGGESQNDVADRATDAADKLAARGTPVLVVSHRMFMSQMVVALLGGGGGRSFHFENTGVTELGVHADGFWQVHRHNDARHLEAALGDFAAR